MVSAIVIPSVGNGAPAGAVGGMADVEACGTYPRASDAVWGIKAQGAFGKSVVSRVAFERD
ncbi:hypothetical protein [Celeribacter sp.]|uniref:hypothetical protein n=1 Tax=Celeribacter sp. TaxID=1890673 RepID=UPI003A9360B6